MQKITHQMLVLTSAFALTATTAQAWDFSYGYQNVYSANAGNYIVGQQNVARYSEWQSPPFTYWGPSGNGVLGTLTSKFNFSAATTEISLNASLVSFNWTGGAGVGSGASSLWGSKDGVSWQLLLDDPTPPNGTYAMSLTYRQDVPSSLLGGTSFWLQTRMQESGTGGGYSNAQFGRTDSSVPGNIFELDAMLVPEPSMLGLAFAGAFAVLCRRVRNHRR